MVLVLGIGVSIGVFLFAVAEPIFHLFISRSDAGYASILNMGKECVRILAFFYSMYALQQALIAIMNGIGATLPVMIIGLCCTALRVPLTYGLAMITHRYQGLFWATNIHNTLLMLGIYIYYRFGNWKRFVQVKRSSVEAAADAGV